MSPGRPLHARCRVVLVGPDGSPWSTFSPTRPRPGRSGRALSARCASGNGTRRARTRVGAGPQGVLGDGPRARLRRCLRPQLDHARHGRRAPHRGHPVGARAGARARLPHGHPVLAHAAARGRRGCPGPRLLLGLLLADRLGPRALRRRAHGVRGGHGRSRHGRRHAAPVHLLGAHDGLLVPADRPLRRPQGEPTSRDAGHHRHDRRRPGDARGRRDPGRRRAAPSGSRRSSRTPRRAER